MSIVRSVVVPRQSAAEWALTRHAARQLRRGALLVALVAGGMSAIVAIQYRTTFAGALDGAALRALAANPAIRVLFGQPVALDDPGGFTVWRTGTAVQVLVAVWALLAATRITRGEEDTGRADLLLAGRLTNASLTVRCLAVVACGALVVSTAVALALAAAGTAPAGAVVHACGVAGTGLTFAAAGTFAAQVLPTRGAATGAAVAVLGASLLVRMLADGSDRLAWLAWLSPFGLTAKSAPYADDRIAPLLVLAVAALALASAATLAAHHRDIGGGLVAVPVARRPHRLLLGSVPGFAVRRTWRPTLGWAVGVAAYFLLVGTVTAEILEFLRDNPRFAELAAAAGFARLGTVDGFAAAMFGLLAIPAGLYAATRIVTMVADEAGRRWTALLALPMTRTRLAASEAAVTAGGVLVLVTAAAVALWIDSPIGWRPALAGALNVAPVAALSLASATLALGWAPRATAVVGAIPVVGGYLLQVIGESVDAPAWLTGLSPFAHLAAVPASPPDWPATAVFTATAALLTVLGIVGYARRDLTT